jgi:hypothetical protein
MANQWGVVVYVTLRPETFYLSLHSGGTLSGYHPKVFTIAPPRLERAIEKRLKFAIKIASGEIPLTQYGITQNFTNLGTLLRILLNSLNTNSKLDTLLVNVSGGNVRLALGFIKAFLGSGHVDTEKILRIYHEQHDYTIPLHEFLRSVLFGDHIYYNSDSSYIANVLDISTPSSQEHFLLPIMLEEIRTWSGPGNRSGFVETDLVYDKLQSMGFTQIQVDNAVVRGQRKNLLESSSRRPFDIGNIPHSLRVTTVGAYHVEFLLTMFAYYDAVVVDTPILDVTIKEQLYNVEQLHSRLQRADLFLDYLNSSWLSVNFKSGLAWPRISESVRKDIEDIRNKIQNNY